MKDLTDRLAALTPDQRALLEARLRQKGLTAPRSSAIRPLPGREALAHFPTSLDQERLWFIDQMEPGNPAYNIHTSTRLTGPFEPELMERAVNAAIARHEILRTTFHVVDGVPVQVVAKELEIRLPILDLTHVPREERDQVAHEVAVEFASVRFDLEKGPLIQVGIARFDAEDHVLMICQQHAITDRWSFDIFEKEIGETYVALRQGRTVEFPPLPIQFADFAAWQREELSGERLEEHLSYWRRQLEGAPLVLEIPTDRPRPPVQTFSGAREYVIYSEDLLYRLKNVTQQAGATMFMTTLAALSVLSWKYAGQRDLIIGSAIADRNRPETENVLGYFLNMLLLRARIDPAMTFQELLLQVRDTALGAYAHQDVPFATLVSELGVRQDPSRNPLIQVSFIYLDFPILTTPEFAGFSATSIDVDNGASRFDMTLACTEVPGLGIHSYIEYNTDLYDKPKVDRMLAHLGRILDFAAENPHRPLHDLELLTRGERAELLDAFHPPARAYEEVRLHALVERAARARPDAPAVSCGSSRVNFRELEAAAERVAARLRASGVGPGEGVPICATRSLAQVFGLYGILKSGAAYVPLDPAHPLERLTSMIADVRPRVVLVQEQLRDRIPQTGAKVLSIEDILASVGDGVRPGGSATDSSASLHKLASSRPEAHPDDLAYIMFTSGSTGVPKGVLVSHRAIGNRVLWSQDRYPIHLFDRVLHNASYGFDIAAWELFGPLLAGAAVILPQEGERKDPAALVRLLREERITIAHFVPSVLRALLDEPGFADGNVLRLVFCGGEGMDRELHDRFFRELPGRTLAHFYGPTEAAISSLYWDCGPDLAPGPVPIGRPISNSRAYLLDETGRPVPAGVPGEIYLGGAGLARGYLERPDLTAERFVPDPVSSEPGARLYRTGDLAKFTEEGAVVFLGRTDHQFKIRGHRIEPGEIETVLERMPGVAKALAIAQGNEAEKRLVAYVTADGTLPDESALRAELRRSLPEYMIPAAFVALESFPLNANGKIDRASLPEPGASPSRAVYVAPRTSTEETIAEIWQMLLRREQAVGAEDDFFDLGGNSLLATQVVSRIRSAFPIDFPLRRFFEGSTVAALAATVDDLLLKKLESMSDEEATRLLENMRRSPHTS